MIALTRINGTPLLLNSDLIEHVETTPDTVISLVNGEKLMVRESPETLLEKIIHFRRNLYLCPALRLTPPANDAIPTEEKSHA